jgi:Transcriptional regulators
MPGRTCPRLGCSAFRNVPEIVSESGGQVSVSAETRPEPVIRVADVAAAAGVSPATASKALNNTGQLRESTRRRVRDAADRLGYVHEPSRSPTTSRTITVGLLTGDSIGRFSLPILLGAENALSLGQIMVLLCDSRDDPLREQYYVQQLLKRNVDGLIVTGRRTDPRPPIDVELPVVYAMAPSSREGDCSVVPDDAEGSRLVFGHLASLGRSRIAHVTGPADHLSARVRADALVECARKADTPLVADPLFGEWGEAWGRAAADVLLSGDSEVDAITCGNDQIARGVTERLRERGVRVPTEIAVTGFDDWDMMAEGARPPLTTIDLQLGEIGRRSAELLIEAIAGRPRTGVERVAPRLVTRGSTLDGS